MGQYYSLHRAVVKTGTVCRKVQPSEAPEFLNRTVLVESWWRGGDLEVGLVEEDTGEYEVKFAGHSTEGRK